MARYIQLHFACWRAKCSPHTTPSESYTIRLRPVERFRFCREPIEIRSHQLAAAVVTRRSRKYAPTIPQSLESQTAERAVRRGIRPTSFANFCVPSRLNTAPSVSILRVDILAAHQPHRVIVVSVDGVERLHAFFARNIRRPAANSSRRDARSSKATRYSASTGSRRRSVLVAAVGLIHRAHAFVSHELRL